MGGLCSGGADSPHSTTEPDTDRRRSRSSGSSKQQAQQNTDERLISPSSSVDNSWDKQADCESPSKHADGDIPPRVPDDDLCPSRPISPPLHPKLVNRNCNIAVSNHTDVPSTPSVTKDSSANGKLETLKIACTAQSYNPSPPSTPRENSPSATEAEAEPSAEPVEESESAAKSDHLPQPYKEPPAVPENKKRECSVFLGLGGTGYPYETKQDYLEYREYIINIVRTKLDQNKIPFHNIALHPRKRFAWINLYAEADAHKAISIFSNMEVEANRRGVKTRIMAEMSRNQGRKDRNWRRGGRGDTTLFNRGIHTQEDVESRRGADVESRRGADTTLYSRGSRGSRGRSQGRSTDERRSREDGRGQAQAERGAPTVLYSRYVGADLLDILNQTS